MVIRQKKDKDLEAAIEKAGSVSSDHSQDSEIEWKFVSLRITTEMLSEIEKEVKQRPGLSRNAWMLEALNEKLKKLREN